MNIYDLADMQLGILIREPFANKYNNAEAAVNADLAKYAQRKKIDGLTEFQTVQTIPNLKDRSYGIQIMKIADYIIKNKKTTRMTKWNNTPRKLRDLLTGIVSQLNSNTDISLICVDCVFKHVVAWKPYGNFTKCTKKCDNGTQLRYRECNTGIIEDCKKYVGGAEVEVKSCNQQKCEWIEDKRKKCDAYCGDGLIKIHRHCETNRDEDCVGDSIIFEPCYVECKWLPYGEWSDCSAICNEGTKTRKRNCSAGNVQYCKDKLGGLDVEEQSCIKRKCKWIVDRKEKCDAQCGSGSIKIDRYCETGRGEDCEGNSVAFESCYVGVVGCAGYIINFCCHHSYELFLVAVAIIINYLYLPQTFQTSQRSQTSHRRDR